MFPKLIVCSRVSGGNYHYFHFDSFEEGIDYSDYLEGQGIDHIVLVDVCFFDDYNKLIK